MKFVVTLRSILLVIHTMLQSAGTIYELDNEAYTVRADTSQDRM